MKKLFLLAAFCALFCACNRNNDGCCPTQTCAQPSCAPKPCCPKPCCPTPKPCCPTPKPCCPTPKPCCPQSSYGSNGGSANGSMMNDQDQQMQNSSDSQITMRVKQAIMSDSDVSARARFVSVSTTNGVVTLTGTVSSDNESRMIERKVKSVQGVRSVDNQLMIGS